MNRGGGGGKDETISISLLSHQRYRILEGNIRRELKIGRQFERSGFETNDNGNRFERVEQWCAN